MSLPDKRISKLTLGTSRGLCEIFAPLYMYKMRYSFPLKRFVRDVFSCYQLGSGQLHPNKWTLMSVFKINCRMVGLEPTINFFRSCYQFIFDIDCGNDIC